MDDKCIYAYNIIIYNKSVYAYNVMMESALFRLSTVLDKMLSQVKGYKQQRILLVDSKLHKLVIMYAIYTIAV